MKKSLLIDVDGVMARYDGNYVPGTLSDPVEGTQDALNKLRSKYLLTAFTSRDLDIFKSWADKHGIGYDNFVQKPLCFAMLDDRAIQFRGNWDRALEEIENFKPWWKE